MNFIESFNNKTILIPLLQRDYVQGSEKSAIISPFLDALIENECDLNYIYGYEEDGCFVPVDGQQRLTTLWLLHLYLFASRKITCDYNVHMKFASREYAEDFCERIHEHLQDLLPNAGKYKSLDEAIKDQYWFIQSWLNNTSVKSMLGTLKLIHRKVTKDNIETIWNKLINTPTPSVSFAFLQMDESNGLDDDIYIKMNGRGRKLSAFENLKSWMDEKISTHDYSNMWKSAMDNEWTNFFWQNRNKSQEHPEEIDDEQLFFFYNLLILYHTKTGELSKTIARIRIEDAFLFEELLGYFNIGSEADDKKVTSGIIDCLQKAAHVPLLWFDRLNLMSDDFLLFAFNALNQMVSLYDSFNNIKLYIGDSIHDNTELSYKLSMCEGSFNRTLPLFYALLSFKGGETTLFDWMRVLRNLILNSDITRDNLTDIMVVIEEFSVSCQYNNIYTVLNGNDAKASLKGFKSSQIDEEILKSKHPLLYDQMVGLENGRFFSGHISVLFKMLTEEPGMLTKDNADAYKNVLLNVFDGSEGGVTAIFDDDKYLLRRALMSLKPYYFGLKKNGYWSFCNGIDEWREYVDSNEEERKALYSLMKDLLVPAYNQQIELLTALSNWVEGISMNYEKDLVNPDESSYRYHFIHHPGVWKYMQSKRCSWNEFEESDGYDIELKTSNGNNSDRMELRTYGLYLDYRYNEEFKIDRSDWKIGIWAKWKSCMYLEREYEVDNNTIKLAIDVYFYDQNKKRTNENCYSFDLFVRSSHPAPENDEEKRLNAEDDYQTNISVFGNLIPELMNKFVRKEDGRLHSNVLYSRSDVREMLKIIMQGINKSITDNV